MHYMIIVKTDNGIARCAYRPHGIC